MKFSNFFCVFMLFVLICTVSMPGINKINKPAIMTLQASLLMSADLLFKNILIIDDESDEKAFGWLTLVLENVLGTGIKVTGISDPEEAIDLFNKDPNAFDLVITDLNMPGKDGIAVIKDFRQINKTVTMVLWTGEPDADKQVKEANVSSQIQGLWRKSVLRDKKELLSAITALPPNADPSAVSAPVKDMIDQTQQPKAIGIVRLLTTQQNDINITIRYHSQTGICPITVSRQLEALSGVEPVIKKDFTHNGTTCFEVNCTRTLKNLQFYLKDNDLRVFQSRASVEPKIDELLAHISGQQSDHAGIIIDLMEHTNRLVISGKTNEDKQCPVVSFPWLSVFDGEVRHKVNNLISGMMSGVEFLDEAGSLLLELSDNERGLINDIWGGVEKYCADEIGSIKKDKIKILIVDTDPNRLDQIAKKIRNMHEKSNSNAQLDIQKCSESGLKLLFTNDRYKQNLMSKDCIIVPEINADEPGNEFFKESIETRLRKMEFTGMVISSWLNKLQSYEQEPDLIKRCDMLASVGRIFLRQIDKFEKVYVKQNHALEAQNSVILNYGLFLRIMEFMHEQLNEKLAQNAKAALSLKFINKSYAEIAPLLRGFLSLARMRRDKWQSQSAEAVSDAIEVKTTGVMLIDEQA